MSAKWKLVTVRFILVFLLVLAIFNEFLVYHIVPIIQWPRIRCNNSDNDCTVLLFVADPQILGENTEYALARLDSDRFLRNTFSVALQWVEPDGIIFLGDIMDEGVKATDEQFKRYYNRFRSIFQFQKLIDDDISMVFVPGDNDIGGENNEIIQAENVNRFRKHFGRDDISYIRHIHVSKVNKLLRTYSQLEDKLSNRKSNLNIAISHVPLNDVPEVFTRNVVRDLKPELIFSAHEHISYAISTIVENGKRLYTEQLIENSFRKGVSTWSFQAAVTTNYTVITEIVVPTCSYRMGVANMAYGVLVHSKNQTEIIYYVLWLPSRFLYILYYIFFFFSSMIFFCCVNGVGRMYFRRCFSKYC